MATASKLTCQLNDITTCPICMEDFDNPKSLPCLHTFCLKCLQRYHEDSYTEDEVACPICREEFELSAKGLDGLRHNFLIQRLVDEKNDSTSVVPSRDTRTAGESLVARGIHCDKHKDKTLELYCFDCRANICSMCFFEEHRHHKCEEVSKVAEAFIKQIDNDVKQVIRRSDAVRKEVQKVKQQKDNFLDETNKTEQAIIRKGEEVKRLVDIQVGELLQELHSEKSKSMKQIEAQEDRVETAIVAMESFKAYSLEVKTKGRPSDITQAAGELHVRAGELLEKYIIPGDYRAPDVSFIPVNIGDLKAAGDGSLVGHLQADSAASPPPTASATRGVRALSLTERAQEQHTAAAATGPTKSQSHQKKPLWKAIKSVLPSRQRRGHSDQASADVCSYEEVPDNLVGDPQLQNTDVVPNGVCKRPQ